MKILGRNFPIFNKAVKWVCRPSQVIGDDGKSIEDKLEEIGTNGGGSESNGSGNNLLTLTLYGDGDEVPNEEYVRFTIVDDTLPPSDDDDDSGNTPKKTDTKIGGTKAEPSSAVKKSEVDAIVNAGAYCHFALLEASSSIPDIIGILVLKDIDNEGNFFEAVGNSFSVEQIVLTINLSDNVVDISYTSLISDE